MYSKDIRWVAWSVSALCGLQTQPGQYKETLNSGEKIASTPLYPESAATQNGSKLLIFLPYHEIFQLNSDFILVSG